jgi:hypothetical protein
MLEQPAPEPEGQPADLEQTRIAHNLALARGDQPLAEKWREKIDPQLDRTVTAKYDTGLQLIGVRVLGGVEPRIESWFYVGGAFAGDATFDVRSSIERRATLSLIAPDPVDRAMAWPDPLPTKLWKAGASTRRRRS